jgi:mono/diheme cytochrome c family protein
VDVRLRPTCIVIALGSLTGSVAGRAHSVADALYTQAQAARGKAVYEQTCSRCHGETFLGGDDAKPLVGEAFLKKWDGQPVWAFFDVIRRTMPDDGPGVLSRREAADVVAYLFSANGFPAGQTELVSEEAPLKDMLIKATR